MRQLRQHGRVGCIVVSIAITTILPAVGTQPTFAASVQVPASIETVAGIDTSNQAGWWTPLVEFGGATYYAFDAPGSQAGTHVVYVAERGPSGATASSCLTAAGRCLEFSDDIGHHQPSIAVDGAGFIHVLTGMHSSRWQQRYFRSTAPNSVAGFTVRSATLPDQTWTFTYPVLAAAPDGGLYLAAYRYRRWDGERMHVRRAAWDGSQWRRTVVYQGKYDTFPAVDVTGTGTNQRIYYVKRNSTGGPAAFVAERSADGTYIERSLASTRPKIERLSVIGRPNGTDVVYLSAPFTSAGAGQLYLGTVPRSA